MWALRTLGLAALLLRADTTGPPPACTERTPTTNVFRVTTLPFTAVEPHADPFAIDAGLSATFSNANGSAALTVRGYWDGGQAWKVRFAAPEPGCWAWATSCLPRSTADAGLCPRSGLIRVLPAAESERRRLFRHGGFLRPSPKGVAGRAHLQHTDGTPFWWLADTLWTAPSSRKW